MKIYNDLPQHLEDGTANPDWLALRAGKFTGSDFNQYMPIMKKGELSDTAESNLYKKVLETFGEEFDTPTTEDMARGTALEPFAREEYIAETFNDVKEVAFVDWEKLRAGCSPDGCIFGDDGQIAKIIEIKSPCIKNYLKMVSDKIPPLYYTQIQFNLLITGAKSCDFVVYHPEMRLFVKEISVDESFQKDIIKALEKLNIRYDEILEKIKRFKK